MHDVMASYDSLYCAFQTVKENHGSPGVDGVTIERFEDDFATNLSFLSRELRNKSYSPLPLLRILVDKGNGEARPLCIPAVRDRVVQTAVLKEIEPILDKEFEDCSFAYRRGRSVRQAAHRIQELYNDGYRWLVDADIDAFFDKIDHGLLFEKLRRYIHNEEIEQLIKMWVKGEVWDGESIFTIKEGIPQGSPVSPILANLFLDELDEALLEQNQKLVRFADDFVVLCRTKEDAWRSLELTNDVLRKLHLELDEADITSFDHGFTFLGVTFVRSLIMVPFDRPKKERKVLYYPPPLDMTIYDLKKKKGW
ncbi:MAG: Group II intron-encoded protein LtrA [Syntrophorhabdus sp. PtaU1.Bin002]|nr:MAG: Group II intron-encoded protein LtrA [Syntrophorhabdus sp. PtaU1.Bin002]